MNLLRTVITAYIPPAHRIIGVVAFDWTCQGTFVTSNHKMNLRTPRDIAVTTASASRLTVVICNLYFLCYTMIWNALVQMTVGRPQLPLIERDNGCITNWQILLGDQGAFQFFTLALCIAIFGHYSGYLHLAAGLTRNYFP